MADLTRDDIIKQIALRADLEGANLLGIVGY